jgi:hypothetical protein
LHGLTANLAALLWVFALAVGVAGSVGLPVAAISPAQASGLLDEMPWRIGVGVFGTLVFVMFMLYALWRVLQLTRVVPVLVATPDGLGGFDVHTAFSASRRNGLPAPLGATIRVRSRAARGYQLLAGRAFMYEWTVTSGSHRLRCLSPLTLSEDALTLVVNSDGLVQQ